MLLQKILKSSLEALKCYFKRFFMDINVYSVVQLLVWPRQFVHSAFRSFVFTGERSVDRTFARSSACAFVCISGWFTFFMDINTLYKRLN